MIRTGSKVIVLASSLRGGIGPRRGSIGYASNSPALRDIHYSYGFDCFAQPIQIAFTRYGFEKTQRKEIKFFINVIPFARQLFETTKPVTLDTIDSLINRVNRIKTEGSFWNREKNRVTSVFGRKNIHVGIVVPILSRYNLLGMGTEEFEAWIGTFLMNHEFHQLTSAMHKKLGQMGGIVERPFLIHILNMLVGKRTKGGILPSLTVDVAKRKALVETIIKVMAVGTSRSCVKGVSDDKTWFESTNMSINKESLTHGIGRLLSNLYSEADFIKKVDLINKVQDKEVKLTTKFVVDLKERLLCLAQSLERQA